MAKKQTVSVISGMNGFIGTHMAKYLYNKGHKVARIPRELLIDPIGLKRFMDEANPDYIFHLATAGNIYNEHPDDEIFVSNVFDTYNLLATMRERKFKGLVNFSSSSVNLFPTIYSTTKLCGEKLAEVVALKYNKPIVSVRPYTVYGVLDRKEHLIPTIINKLKTGEQLDLVADPVHDYIYIDDLVRAVWLVAKNAKNLQGQSIDLGTGIQTSNLDVLKGLEQISGLKANVNEIERMREYDTTNWSANTEIIEGLGWKPKVSLEKGLKKTYEGA